MTPCWKGKIVGSNVPIPGGGGLGSGEFSSRFASFSSKVPSFRVLYNYYIIIAHAAYIKFSTDRNSFNFCNIESVKDQEER